MHAYPMEARSKGTCRGSECWYPLREIGILVAVPQDTCMHGKFQMAIASCEAIMLYAEPDKCCGCLTVGPQRFELQLELALHQA